MDHSSLGDRRRLQGERILGKAGKEDGMQGGPVGLEKTLRRDAWGKRKPRQYKLQGRR